MRRLQINDRLSVEELDQRYRAANDPVARSQWQMVWLLAQGHRSEEVAAVTGYSLEWIRVIARRYNAQGAAGIGDQRHHNRGKPASLNVRQQTELQQELTAAMKRGDRWDSQRVAAWMSERLGRTVYPQRGWEMLRKLGYTSKTPRPRHQQADEEEQRLFKKTSRKP
jgi:transposase